MDSVSQFVLGAAVGIATLGRRTALWKAALWGGVVGTLPDLDAFIDHGDPVRNMTLHRTESHALFWLTLGAPPLAALIARLQGEMHLFRRWWLAVWLALITHPLLDLMTVYGTQLGLPFTDFPYAVGSVFIIDPLYTLPLLAGVGMALALARQGRKALRWNAAGLVLSTAYLAWGWAAQQHVLGIAQAALRAQGLVLADTQVLVTPAPFNTVLWRVVAIDPEAYHEGFYSLLDATPRVRFRSFDRGAALDEALHGDWVVDRMAWFTKGFYKLEAQGEQVQLSDLRMGQEPNYSFRFAVATRRGATVEPLPAPLSVGRLVADRRAFEWLWRRVRGEDVDPP